MEESKAAVLAHRINNMPDLYEVEGGRLAKPMVDAHNSVVKYLTELTNIVIELFDEAQPYYNAKAR
jgi:hypothetical protein